MRNEKKRRRRLNPSQSAPIDNEVRAETDDGITRTMRKRIGQKESTDDIMDEETATLIMTEGGTTEAGLLKGNLYKSRGSDEEGQRENVIPSEPQEAASSNLPYDFFSICYYRAP